MGHVTPSDTPADYPARTGQLDRASALLLVALRWWVAAHHRREDPLARLTQALDDVGIPDAAFPVNALMEVLARTARAPVDIRCARCPRLSDDEANLLHAASLAQAGLPHAAEQALRTTLLDARGASFALAPLCGLGLLFAEQGLHFRRWRAPHSTPWERSGHVAWTPADGLHAAAPRTLH